VFSGLLMASCTWMQITGTCCGSWWAGLWLSTPSGGSRPRPLRWRQPSQGGVEERRLCFAGSCTLGGWLRRVQGLDFIRQDPRQVLVQYFNLEVLYSCTRKKIFCRIIIVCSSTIFLWGYIFFKQVCIFGSVFTVFFVPVPVLGWKIFPFLACLPYFFGWNNYFLCRQFLRVCLRNVPAPVPVPLCQLSWIQALLSTGTGDTNVSRCPCLN
jgi:hypothetical protein